MSFPPYPKYKPSGVEWLGDVPEHWELKRLKHNCRVFPSNVDKKTHEDETPVQLCNYTDVYYNDSITRDLDFMEATATEDQIDRFTLLAGDTIITKDSESPDDIAVAAYVPFKLHGVICGYHLAVIRPYDGTVGNFIKRFFDSRYAKSSFATLANGLTRHALGQYELKNVVLATPPLAEQTQIAAFLDRETGKIDELVAEQRRLIELLKEKRQAVISHAVTRGLNPNAPTKPSGIQWLGNIPEHWEVKKVKHLASRISSGKTPLGGSEVYVDQGVTFLRSQNVYDEGLRLDDVVFISDEVDIAMAVSRVKPNDILLNITGASIGRSCVVPENIESANVNQHVCVIRLRTSSPVQFVSWLFKATTIKLQIDHAQNGAAREGLNFVQIGLLDIVLPPHAEQLDIVAHLDAETAKLDALTAEAERAIELLQERRTALISSAVTGKIDVRELSQRGPNRND